MVVQKGLLYIPHQERLIVRFKDHPLGTVIQGLFDLKGSTPDKNVFPFQRKMVKVCAVPEPYDQRLAFTADS
jgi:hypothetical protein